MADLPVGYAEVPEADRKAAKRFFDVADTKAQQGQYDYALSMYLDGLAKDPDEVEAHKKLRDAAFRRKAAGGKAMGFMEKMKLRSGKDAKDAMLVAERLLAHEPGGIEHMMGVFRNALKAGYFDTVLWMGVIALRANKDGPDDANVYVELKDGFKGIREYRLAVEACQEYCRVRPTDMDMQTELKNLGALETMDKGKYGTARSFRDSVRNMDKQQALMERERGVVTVDLAAKLINDAREQYERDPNEAGKLMRLVEALVKTENADHENEAIALLDAAHQRTGAFRFRQNVGRIKMRQLDRMERGLRDAAKANPTDAAARQEHERFAKDKLQEELREFELWVENYPTDNTYRFELGKRMFALGRWDDAIPVFQQARNDPKLRVDAAVYLGRAFLESGFADEAVDTLKAAIDEYQIKGDPRSLEMNYWYGRALEQKGDIPAAVKSYSQVAQWSFTYRDVQQRIKKLRTPPQGQAAPQGA